MIAEKRKLFFSFLFFAIAAQDLLALITASRQWCCFLNPNLKEVVVIADHKPNPFLHSKPSVSRQQAHWQNFLSFLTSSQSTKRGVLMLMTPSVAALDWV